MTPANASIGRRMAAAMRDARRRHKAAVRAARRWDALVRLPLAGWLALARHEAALSGADAAWSDLTKIARVLRRQGCPAEAGGLLDAAREDADRAWPRRRVPLGCDDGPIRRRP